MLGIWVVVSRWPGCGAVGAIMLVGGVRRWARSSLVRIVWMVHRQLLNVVVVEQKEGELTANDDEE